MGDDIFPEEQQLANLDELMSDSGFYKRQGLNQFPWDLNNKKEEPVENSAVIDCDVLALVLLWSSVNLQPSLSHGGSKYNYWCSIIRSMVDNYAQDEYDLEDVFTTPTEQNLEKATEILDYYKLKISHRALVGDMPFSEYEDKLSKFVNTPVEEFDLDTLGVIVRLETTYSVDKTFDGFIEKYDSIESVEDPTLFQRLHFETNTHVLKFVKKVNVLGNKDNNIRYYFEKENELYCMRFGEKNPLLNVLDHVLETKGNILTLICSLSTTVLYANSDFWYHTINEGFVIE
jgi:hypothetical protein|tara:strand:- start:833 stop:1696 length:864 start_codon:yes stop_codon:yes gene_type:complete